MPILDKVDKVIYTDILHQISWMPLGNNSRGMKFFYNEEERKYTICDSVDDYKKNIKRLGYVIRPLEDLYADGLESLVEISKTQLLINGEEISEITSFSQLIKYFGITSFRIKRLKEQSGISKLQAYKRLMNKNVVVDHLGNEFLSKNEMYRFWGKDKSVVNQRLKSGYSLQEALEKNVSKKRVTDHLGNEYKNKNEMLKKYGINNSTFNRRLKKGMTLEEALTNRSQTGGKKTVDHLGNEFASQTALCQHYNIERRTFVLRLNAGMTIEEALTTPTVADITDHLGNKFKSAKDMCKYYGLGYYTFKRRIEKMGWSIEKALTTPVGKNEKK